MPSSRSSAASRPTGASSDRSRSLPTYYSPAERNQRAAQLSSTGGVVSGGGGAAAAAAAGSSSSSSSKARSGPNRTTKASGKLKILPEEPEDGAAIPSGVSTVPRTRSRGQQTASNAATSSEDDDDDDDDDEDDSGEGLAVDDDTRAEVRNQLARIPEGSMRRDARRLTRKGRASLPRVTAYSTATSYRMRDLIRWLQARKETHRTNVMTFDECVYTTYTYEVVDEARGGGGSVPHGFGGGAAGVVASIGKHYHGLSASISSAANTAGARWRHAKDANGSHTDGPPRSPSAFRQQQGRTGDLLGIPELRQEEIGDGSAASEQQQRPSNSESHEASNDNMGTLVELEAGEGGDAAGRRQQQEKSEEEREAQRIMAREEARRRRRERFSVKGLTPEVFFMEYGTVVIWGMTLAEEKRLLREIRKFEVEKLAPEDVESEDLNWYLADYSRIYNDVITLRKGSSYMTKLSLSHALAQSTKISFFEGVIESTIDTTKDIPQSIADTGKIGMPPAEIMKQIGHLFILRMNIHLVGSIVDSPEIFWSQPDLEPLYSAARSYLEIPQRIELLNARVLVLQDLLELLKDQVQSSHSEWLEIVVIALIVLEIILGVATMLVDLAFG